MEARRQRRLFTDAGGEKEPYRGTHSVSPDEPKTDESRVDRAGFQAPRRFAESIGNEVLNGPMVRVFRRVAVDSELSTTDWIRRISA
jgi:hypothetical protein